jgi:hypothetical protein
MDPLTSLFIRFGAPVTDTGDSPMIAEVIRHDLSLAWRGTISLATGLSVPLDKGGHFLVRAWLPNGELLMAQAEADEGQSTEVRLYPERRSPREDYAWAYYVQPKASIADVGMLESDGRLRPFSDIHEPDKTWGRFEIRVVFGGRNLLRDESAGNVTVEPDATEPEPSKIVTLLNDVPTRVRVQSKEGQVWLRIQTMETSLKHLIGTWWAALPSIDGANTEVLLSLDPVVGLRVNVQIDPFANTLLSYVQRGDYGLARLLTAEMADRAESILREKRRNPVLAAVAAYALLRAGDFKRLHDWTFNLANWFEDLPDGPIIAAWHLLNTTGEINEARPYFQEAVTRGAPLFSVGLRLLFELGEIIQSANDENLTSKDRDRIRWVRMLEAARQRFATVTLLRELPWDLGIEKIWGSSQIGPPAGRLKDGNWMRDLPIQLPPLQV